LPWYFTTGKLRDDRQCRSTFLGDIGIKENWTKYPKLTNSSGKRVVPSNKNNRACGEFMEGMLKKVKVEQSGTNSIYASGGGFLP
jgi:hypothetical protein